MFTLVQDGRRVLFLDNYYDSMTVKGSRCWALRLGSVFLALPSRCALETLDAAGSDFTSCTTFYAVKGTEGAENSWWGISEMRHRRMIVHEGLVQLKPQQVFLASAPALLPLGAKVDPQRSGGVLLCTVHQRQPGFPGRYLAR